MGNQLVLKQNRQLAGVVKTQVNLEVEKVLYE